MGIISQTLLPRIGGGRIAAHEFLVVTPGIANLIRENKTFRITSAIQTGAKQGMVLMDDAIVQTVARAKGDQGRRPGQGPTPGGFGETHCGQPSRACLMTNEDDDQSDDRRER